MPASEQCLPTSDLHKEADILTPFQKAYCDKAVMFWRIINNCEPQELLIDLLLQGYHNKWQKIFHLQQSISTKILYIVPAKCDI
jgi:hypothetical protein